MRSRTCLQDGETGALSEQKNLWFKDNGNVIKNPSEKPSHDLDIYPMPDYSMEDHHIMYDGKIQPLTYEIMRQWLEKGTVSGYIKKIGTRP